MAKRQVERVVTDVVEEGDSIVFETMMEGPSGPVKIKLMGIILFQWTNDAVKVRVTCTTGTQHHRLERSSMVLKKFKGELCWFAKLPKVLPLSHEMYDATVENLNDHR